MQCHVAVLYCCKQGVGGLFRFKNQIQKPYWSCAFTIASCSCSCLQGLRASTAAAAPAPGQVVDAILQSLTPQLPGPDGASADELSTVLQSLVKLGCHGVDQDWLARVLDGAESKLSAAVADGRVGVLVNILAALGQLSVNAAVAAPAELLTVALDQVKAVLDQLDAGQIAVAMSALKQLNLDPDDSLMTGYLERAAAAAASGAATPRDMATVLQSVSAAGVIPPAGWYQQYLAAVRQQLAAADSDTLANICHAAAALAVAAQQNSSSSSFQPDTALLNDLVSAANSRISSSYMDAARILSSPDYKAPLTLSSLADCCWALLKLGAPPAAVQSLISMFVSKGYDRLSQLSGAQLAGAVWAIATCNSSSASSGGGKKGGSSSTGIKLPGKWLNQLATAAAPEARTLNAAQLSDFIWGLGKLYLSAEGYSSAPASSGSSSSNSTAVTAGSSSAEPVQQLLRSVASQVNAQPAQQTPAGDISMLVKLLAQFECPAGSSVLQRFCAEVSADWQALSDVDVADAAVAMAVLAGPGANSATSCSTVGQEWLQSLAEQVQQR